ncbi:MAG: hypothetical protein M1606_02670 [Candidatus Thermoplasmatota archaeon]|nr:hypothetical protein [Candidatus Thermoplasmatota archaeon]MCL5983552.1 hypothetical protein [Candidatus Thermoplasmatota archaeon]
MSPERRGNPTRSLADHLELADDRARAHPRRGERAVARSAYFLEPLLGPEHVAQAKYVAATSRPIGIASKNTWGRINP